MQEHLRGVSDEELARLIDTVKVKPPLQSARVGMSRSPATRGQVSEVMVRKLKEKWGRMR
jgi:hypothetical protein